MMTFEQRHEGSHADIWGRRFPPHLKGERRHFILYPGLNFNRLKQNKGSLRSRPESGTEIHSTWKANLCLICFRCYWNLKCLLYGRWLKPAGESDALEIQLQMKKQNNTEDGHDNGLAQNNWRLWALRSMRLNSWRQMMRSPVEENIQINHRKVPSGNTTHSEMFFCGGIICSFRKY